MTAITWLHLSDLHFCAPKTGWDAQTVLDDLVTDLKKLENDYQLCPDLIFFTGDLAFGQVRDADGWRLKDQYQGVQSFLETVRTAFHNEIPTENIFCADASSAANMECES